MPTQQHDQTRPQHMPRPSAGQPAWYRRTGVVAVAAVVVGVGAGIGIGSASSETVDPTTTPEYQNVVTERDLAGAARDGTQDRLDAVKGSLDATRGDLAAARRDLDATQGDLVATRGDLEAAGDRIVRLIGDLPEREVALAKAQAELDEREDSVLAEQVERTALLDDRAAELGTQEEAVAAQEEAVAAQEEAVAAREAKVGVAETTIADNTISGEGTYEVGVDIKAGTYKTSGRRGCYYAVLKSPNTSDIADNANIDGPGVVTVAPGRFLASSGCAAWVRQS